MVASLCVWAYGSFFAVVAYSHAPHSAPWWAWTFAISLLWTNSVFNYAACALVDPGYVDPAAVADLLNDSSERGGGGGGEGRARAAPAAASLCKICQRRVHHFDHHCPFTGGCVGGRNFRHFAGHT